MAALHPTLAQRQSDLTRRLVIDAAVASLDTPGGSVEALTMRAVAHAAGIAERTVFRHFASRETMLDAVAAAVAARMALPPPPAGLAELAAAPRLLFERFEAEANLTRAALHTALYDRMRETHGRARWQAIGGLLAREAPSADPAARRIATANVRYHLMASTWHYFRTYFGFSLDDTVAAAETAIGASVAAIGLTLPPARASRLSDPRA